jgi:TolB-like protein/Tfp pilus assembly protein PilF
MAGVFDELKRRNVLRVAVAYAGAGWLLIQLAETVFPLFGFGDEPARIVVIVLAIGFPITLIFSWIFEFTPDGLKLEQDIDPAQAGARHDGKKLDRIIIIVLTIALGYFVIDKFVVEPEASNGDPSVAVLPFADLSRNGDQEYLGDGVAVELLDELDRLDCLRVSPQRSSFSFKGKDESLSAIAEKLDVATIVEGSIRKDGNQVRIMAQLINIADEKILWSKTYNRKLEDIFAIQVDIATEVSGALGVTLGGCGVAFSGAGTRNIEAWEAFLKAGNSGSKSAEAIPHLNRAIELDPNYAAAWSLLAFHTLAIKGWYVYPGENRDNEERAYEFALRATELDPEAAPSFTQLGLMLEVKKDWIRSEENYLKALSMLSNRFTHGQYGSFLVRVGRSADALKQFEQSEAAERLPGHRTNRVHAAIAQGRFDDARNGWVLHSKFPPMKGVDLSIALSEGDSTIIRAMMAAKDPMEIATIELYAPVLEVFDSREMALSTLRAAYADSDSLWPSKLTDIGLLAAYFGDEELALQTIGEESRLGSYRFSVVWYPLMADARQSKAFKDLVTDMNLVEYWRASEWPDLCRPLGTDDFECW